MNVKVNKDRQRSEVKIRFFDDEIFGMAQGYAAAMQVRDKQPSESETKKN